MQVKAHLYKKLSGGLLLSHFTVISRLEKKLLHSGFYGQECDLPEADKLQQANDRSAAAGLQKN